MLFVVCIIDSVTCHALKPLPGTYTGVVVVCTVVVYVRASSYIYQVQHAGAPEYDVRRAREYAHPHGDVQGVYTG